MSRNVWENGAPAQRAGEWLSSASDSERTSDRRPGLPSHLDGVRGKGQGRTIGVTHWVCLSVDLADPQLPERVRHRHTLAVQNRSLPQYVDDLLRLVPHSLPSLVLLVRVGWRRRRPSSASPAAHSTVCSSWCTTSARLSTGIVTRIGFRSVTCWHHASRSRLVRLQAARRKPLRYASERRSFSQR